MTKRISFALALCLFASALILNCFVSCKFNSNSDATVTSYGSITGKACYSNANDFSDITVYLEKTDGLRAVAVIEAVEAGRSIASARSLAGMQTTTSDGAFKFENLEAGVYTIHAESDISQKKAVVKNITVTAGQTTEVEDLILVATGSITGKITKDSSDTLSYGYRISIAGTGNLAITDVDGSFTIENIPAGKHNLLIEREAFCYLVTEPVVVVANQSTDIGTKNFTSEEIYANIKNGEDGISIKWLGSFESEDKISNPEYLDAYFNTTDGCSYIYDGTQWTLLASKGAQGEKGDKGDKGDTGSSGSDGISVVWLGSFADSSLIENPQEMNAYYNTTDGCSYIYADGEWTLLAKAGAQGIQGLSINWRGSFADSSEVTDPQYLDIYYDTTDGCSYIYDGEAWTLITRAGNDAVSVKWMGSLETEPENPSENWAYYNTEDGCSYIYDGTSWTLMAKAGAQGAQGICVVWRGSFASDSEIGNPEIMHAYYNTTDGCSYIYDGTNWNMLVKAGSNGVSITWKGELTEAPENPELNWAYYDKRYGCSYIYDGESWNLLSNGTAPGGITQQPENISFELYSNTDENPKSLQIKFKSSETESLIFTWYKKTTAGNVLVSTDDKGTVAANQEYTSEYILPTSNYMTETFYCVVSNTYEDDVMNYTSEEVVVTQTMPETGLPLVTVDTNKVVIADKENYIPGTIKLEGASDKDWNFDEVALGIRGRGNSTWVQPKKPYALKLDKKQKIMGMPKHKRWVLIANYLDNSFIKNEMAFYLSEKLGMDYTVRGEYVNLILNDEYEGLYWLGEAIKADENRVDIDEDNDYLIELDTYFDETWKFKSTVKDLPYNIKNDDSMNDEKVQYLSDKITEIENILYSDNFPYTDESKTAYDTSYLNYVDVDSFAKFYLVNEIMRNTELKHPKSAYCTFDSSENYLKAGPVWDFDWSACYNDTSIILKQAIYYDSLFKTVEFNQKVYELLHSDLINGDDIISKAEELKTLLNNSQTIDQERWGVHSDPTGSKISEFDTDFDFVESCVTSRLNYLETQKFETAYSLK